MNEQPQQKHRSSLNRNLALILTLIFTVSIALGITAAGGGDWAYGALVGWLVASMLGLFSWWTTRKALLGGGKGFYKYVFGGMLFRLVLCGSCAALVIGMKWLAPAGFVAGLLVGISVFLAVEIAGLEASARRMASRERDA